MAHMYILFLYLLLIILGVTFDCLCFDVKMEREREAFDCLLIYVLFILRFWLFVYIFKIVNFLVLKMYKNAVYL